MCDARADTTGKHRNYWRLLWSLTKHAYHSVSWHVSHTELITVMTRAYTERFPCISQNWWWVRPENGYLCGEWPYHPSHATELICIRNSQNWWVMQNNFFQICTKQHNLVLDLFTQLSVLLTTPPMVSVIVSFLSGLASDHANSPLARSLLQLYKVYSARVICCHLALRRSKDATVGLGKMEGERWAYCHNLILLIPPLMLSLVVNFVLSRLQR